MGRTSRHACVAEKRGLGNYFNRVTTQNVIGLKGANKDAYSPSSELRLRAPGRHVPWDRSVTCQSTQVIAPRLNSSSKLVLGLPTPDRWKAELT